MSPLLSLSDAILAHLRDVLLTDLHASINLSQTCRRLRHFFLEDDEIWRAACFLAGFGRPLKRNVAEFEQDAGESITWRAIAHLVVRHPSVCEIRSCMEANACFSKKFLTFHLDYVSGRNFDLLPPAQHYSLLGRTSIRRPQQSSQNLVVHPLYFYLHFTHTSPPTPPPSASGSSNRGHLPTPSPSPPPQPPTTPDALSILLTHLPTFPECHAAQYGPLCVHPNASCAFATFPPVPRLAFQDADGSPFLIVENPDGCTILDVNRALIQL